MIYFTKDITYIISTYLFNLRIIDNNIEFYVVDATKVAQEANLGKRTNTILQTCFFAISGVLPKDEAIKKVLEDNPRYKSGYDKWASEFKIEGYVIEVYDEKTYNRDKIIEELL